MSGRVHVYLNEAEEAELEREQDERGASASYVMRLGLRLLVGLPVPPRELHAGDDGRGSNGQSRSVRL